MKTKTVRLELTVPETQDPLELRRSLQDRMGWPDVKVEQLRKTSADVEVDSRLLTATAADVRALRSRLEELTELVLAWKDQTEEGADGPH